MGIYIGQQRLGYLWEKIKAIIPTKISDLSNDAGYTTNTGTITGITMNGTSKGTSGIVNLGTVITEHQDISGKANSVDVYTKLEVDDMIEDVAYLGDAVGNETTANFNAQADTVWNKAQTLGSAQQAQARNNIGAVGSVTVNGTTYTPTNGNVDLGTISGGGSSVTVDSALSTSSTNPVQNSVITTALNGKVGSSTITSIVSLTEAAYTALSTKDASTLYVIVES